ncbi:hypothetical protein [Geobacillus sp. PA-3]|nr:hypothetical protein [Geobacillus sp. PA-3]
MRFVICQKSSVIQRSRNIDDPKVIDLKFPVRLLDGFVEDLAIQGFSE